MKKVTDGENSLQATVQYRSDADLRSCGLTNCSRSYISLQNHAFSRSGPNVLASTRNSDASATFFFFPSMDPLEMVAPLESSDVVSDASVCWACL